MSRLLISQRLFDSAVAQLDGTDIEVDLRDGGHPMSRDALLQALQGCDGLVCLLTDVVDRAVLEANPQLRVVANVAVGYDNIDLATAQRLGIAVTNTPGVLTEATADLTLALLLAVARRVVEGDAFVRSGAWSGWQLVPDQMGIEVHGGVLGIIGMGQIGQAVARRAAHGFGMEVRYHSPHRLPATLERELRATAVTLPELLAEADVVSLHAPATDETDHLIGAEELDRMRRDAILINTSRGSLVDEDALVEALQAGTIAGAGLDVFEREPTPHPGLRDLRQRVVLLPHLGSATSTTRRRMAEVAVRDAIAVLAGEEPLHLVRRA